MLRRSVHLRLIGVIVDLVGVAERVLVPRRYAVDHRGDETVGGVLGRRGSVGGESAGRPRSRVSTGTRSRSNRARYASIVRIARTWTTATVPPTAKRQR